MNVYPLALYIVAFAAYLWHFANRQPAVGRAATTLLVAAALTHTFVVGMQTMEAGHVPVMQPGVEDRAPVLQGPLFGLHVLSLLSAYASFALAFVIGVTYVLLFKEIKAKHLGFFYARLPSLQVLDTMNQRTIVFGWMCLTIGIVVGTVWAGQAQAYAAGDPRVQAMSLQDPKIFVALVCWAVYSFEVFAARRMGWGGRRTAYLSAVGFAIVLLNFVPISYFLTTSHNF
jgi:ABC-type transport system involved in cytochrome c biogenesis permease subunit